MSEEMPLDVETIDTVVEETVETEAVKPKDKPKDKPVEIASTATDVVYLARCVYKNKYHHDSLSVRHVQRRLAALGYRTGMSDPAGWYKDGTRSAVAEFQKKKGLEGDGLMNAATLEAIFNGDSEVTLDLS